MRKNLFTRKKVNDPSIDNAIRDIYDKLDKLIPVTIEELAISNFSPTIGTTTFVENANGISSLAVFTKDGWKVDVNSHYELADKNSFIPLKGTKGKTRKIIEGESLSYDDKGNIKLRNKADKKVILNVSDNGIIKVRDATDSNFGDIQCANIKDSNGRKVMEVNTISDNDSTNHIKFSNAATTGSPQIEPDGADTNTSLYLRSKGTGNISASIPGTGNFNVLDDNDIRFRVTPDDVEIALLGQATHVAKIDCQSDAELRIWNFASASPTTGNDISISSDDEIYLAAGGNQIYLNGGGGNGSGTYDKGDTFGYFDFATASTCKLSSALNHHLNLTSLGTGDVVIDSNGDIVLDSNDGNFIAKKAGTEFSAANSAYAGMILGYTYLQPTSTATFEIQDSMTVEDAVHRITFKTPPSENVEIELSCFINVTSTDTNIDVGLSDNSTYNSIGGQFEYDFAGVYLSDDEADDDILTVKWVLSASELAAVGSSNTFYIGFSTAGSTKTAYLAYGYRSSHGVSYPPFIVKATALPETIDDGS